MADAHLAQNFFTRHRSKIAITGPDQCWLWTACQTRGYGTVCVRGTMQRAHRVAYEAANGEGSAAGLVVRHRCDTPSCVNPAHLELGTAADNVRDKVERARQPKGETHGQARLSEADVLAIRATYVRGSQDCNLRALACRFGVSRPLISQILNRHRWGHVT
jgi:hypothetical protein